MLSLQMLSGTLGMASRFRPTRLTCLTNQPEANHSRSCRSHRSSNQFSSLHRTGHDAPIYGVVEGIIE